MVRFRDPDDTEGPYGRRKAVRPAINYRSRSTKLRLLAIVFSLMTVGLMINEAFKPENWAWITGTPGAAKTTPVIKEEDIDTRLQPKTTPPLPKGVFVIPRTPDPIDTTGDTTGEMSEIGLNLGRYQVIKDNTLSRQAERSIWLDTLATLRDWPDAQALPEAQQTSFTQLYRQPEVYRGHLVKVGGVIRRAEYYKTSKNDQGIPGYWQCWLQPTGSSNLIVINVLELPEGFETGEVIYEVASIRGIFFKRWAYRSKGGIMTAPVVLAHSIDWTMRKTSPPLPPPSREKMLLILGGAFVFSVAVAWSVYRLSLRQSKDSISASEAHTSGKVDFNSLGDQACSPDESVRRFLAQRQPSEHPAEDEPTQDGQNPDNPSTPGDANP